MIDNVALQRISVDSVEHSARMGTTAEPPLEAEMQADATELLMRSQQEARRVLDEAREKAHRQLLEAHEAAVALLLRQQDEAARLLLKQSDDAGVNSISRMAEASTLPKAEREILIAEHRQDADDLLEAQRIAAEGLIAAQASATLVLRESVERTAAHVLLTSHKEAAAILLDARMKVMDQWKDGNAPPQTTSAGGDSSKSA